MLAPFTMSLFVMMAFLFVGRIFGRPRFPLRVAFFTWTATLRKILTMKNLKKWHIIVIDKCCM
jgi:hypothetical protein